MTPEMEKGQRSSWAVTGDKGVNGFGRRYGGHLSNKHNARAVLARGIFSLALRVMIKHTRAVQKNQKAK